MGTKENTDPACRVRDAAFVTKTTVRLLGWKYHLSILAIIVFASLSLLPAQLLHFFSFEITHFSKSNFHPFLMDFLAFGAAVVVALSIASLGTILIQEWLRVKISVVLRQRVLKALHTLPAERLDDASRGNWLTKMSRDLRGIETFLGATVPEILRHLAIVLGTLFIFAIHGGWIATIPLITALLLGWYNYRVQKSITPILEEKRTIYGDLFQKLIENLEGWRTIRSLNASRPHAKHFDSVLSDFSEKSLSAAKIFSRSVASNTFITQSLSVACLMIAALAVYRGNITPIQALFYPFYLGLFFISVRSLVSSAYGWNRFIVDSHRVAKLLEVEEVQNDYSDGYVPNIVRLKVSGLVIGYENKPLFKNPISLTLQTGKITGVVGPSGCGKSTLLEVIAGLRRAFAGSANILGGNSSELSALWKNQNTPVQLPTQFFSYVEQKPYLFEGTLRQNLSLHRTEVEDEQLWESIERVGLAKTFEKRGGLNSFITDRGENVSEGERYRIAIARVLVSQRPFLLLDEPFAALDEIATRQLVATIEELRSELGIFIVTHYTPSSLSFDQVYSFHQGPSAPIKESLTDIAREYREPPLALDTTELANNGDEPC